MKVLRRLPALIYKSPLCPVKQRLYLVCCNTENRAKRDVITTLVQRGYPSDPVKAWKDIQKSSTAAEADDDTSDDSSSVASSASGAGGPDFNYLLSMSLLSLSREKKEELLKERDNKVCLRACNSLTVCPPLIEGYFLFRLCRFGVRHNFDCSS